MIAKFVVFAMAVVVAHGSGLAADYTSFAYDVADPNTGDFKNQHETRIGDAVQGQYSLLESDGTRRTVDYAADAYSGFNAVVRKDPAIVAAAPVVAAPIAHIAPLAYGAAPVAPVAPIVTAPVAPLAYAAPAYPYKSFAAPFTYAAHATPLAYASPYGYAKYY